VTQIGKEGRIVGTGFLSTGMPFIRYDTCDFASLVELPTPENGQRMRISSVRPRRKPDFLVSNDGNRVVTIDFTPDHPRFFKGVEEYQFYQEAPGDVLIRYIPSRDGTPSDAERLRVDLETRARGHIRFSTKQVSRIAAGRGGKRAFIDQQLDMSKY
jgi:phenylacetate-CoA ligase